MILRIFNVSIKENLKDEFQKEFEDIATQISKNCEGLISCEIVYPTKAKPNDYQLITKWKDKESLVKFVGEQWDKVLIPEHMQKYPVSSSVEHHIL